MSDAALAEFRALPRHVRAAYVLILEAVVQAVPTRWSHRKGVPLLWITLNGTGEDSEVRVEPTSLGELSAHGYLDEFSRWVGAAVHEKARTSRCAALVHGDRIHARIWGWASIGAGWRAPDSFVAVRMQHQDRTLGSAISLPFTRQGRLFQHLRFDEDVHALLGRAKQL